ncbi:hypothetical protein GCM10011487_28820 [Steroidobacter agaridevorans]|uniref:Uncharacterized protein n=1 Tax=Steroidobacter agaridevorans TaxID=2695856 RepID=A0A829YDX5_9GAMM|nr:hypothetical protein [Steroidobacter agaridevorans]GFE80882.1 hypothetical protein GCM10011487_28820 [Steroidobacter agaridevorans]GFE89234.1 hypothetical protein GCM10011488_41880 [Steroidobacter agaridevorans]
MKLRIAAALCGLMCFGSASADSLFTTGTIAVLRTYSIKHTVTPSRGITIVQLSQAMSGGCYYAYIDAADKASLSMALAAKSSASPVVLWYDPAQTAPWGDTGICALTGLEAT